MIVSSYAELISWMYSCAFHLSFPFHRQRIVSYMQCFYRKRTSMLRSVPLYNPVQCAGKLHACTGAAGITFKMGPAYSFTEKESHSVPTGKSRRKNSGICRWSSGFYQKRAWNRCQEYYLLCGTIAWTVSFFYRRPLFCPANYHLTQDFHCRIQYITFIHSQKGFDKNYEYCNL